MSNTRNLIGLRFMMMGSAALAAGVVFGVIGGFQFLFPQFLEALSFTSTRPLHVSLVVSWIFLAAIGGIYYYLPNKCDQPLWSDRLPKWHFWIFLTTGLCILASYIAGKFGGREYFEYPAALSVPIIASWVLFGLNYFKTAFQHVGRWPVYYWMWGTGILFFMFTFLEAHLWLLPYFRENMVREITVQWKSYGALTGSWNMMVYGTAIFVAGRIAGDKEIGRSNLAFVMYFMGLSGLMFGWAHHTYLVPSAPWIRHLAYVVSMSELLILGKILWDWRASLDCYQKNLHCNAYRFFVAADFWVFINVILAIIISVPVFNLFTHGTHITVAHSMGTTIGINTMILLGSVYYVIREELPLDIRATCSKKIGRGFWITNIALGVFFAALVMAGVAKGMFDGGAFQQMMMEIRPYLMVFAISGVALMLGLWILLYQAIKLLWIAQKPSIGGEPNETTVSSAAAISNTAISS
jgi:nitric oxide reductase subunit B